MKLAMRVQAVSKRVTLIATAFVLAVSTLTASVPFILSQDAGAVSTEYTESFEGTNSWSNSSVVSDNTDPGVVSSDGTHYSRVSSGASTKWGGQYRSEFPAGGYSTSLDLYLKMDTASNGAKEQVDYSSAINNQSGTHLRDFIFHVGTDPTVNGQWFVSASNNSPGNPLVAGNAAISQDGWYTLTHDFKNVGGVLAVTLSVTQKSTGTVLGSWTLSSSSDSISSVVGGNRYGWFTGNPFTIPYVAIDNAKLSIPQLPVKNLTTNETFFTIKDAVNDIHTTNGDVIEVSGNHTVTESTLVNKDVTIRGVSGATISTSGSNQLFTVLANGVTFENLAFQKTDNADQIFIGIQSDNVTVKNSNFSAQYNLATDAGTTRALVVSGGVDDLLITGNIFTNIRQPAYINNFSTGAISNNQAHETRGWVIEKASNFELSGNTWGTNAVDFAVIPGVSPETTANNYTCRIATIVGANNNATIQDQAPAPILSCPNTAPSVSFVGSTPTEGSWVHGTVDGNVLATDDYGMGAYFVRYWKNSFESGASNLLQNCQSAPGAFLLGKTVNTTCSFNTATVADGTKVVLSAQFLDGHQVWGSAQRSFYVDNTAPTISVKTDSTSLVDGTVGTNPYSSISFKLYDEAGNLKEVVLNGHVYPRTNTWNDLNWSNINTGDLMQGENTIIVRDKAGNESAPLSFVYDTVAPDAPTLGVNGLTSGQATNQSSVTATWNKPNSDVVKYEYKYWNEISTSPWSASNPWTTEITGESRGGDFTEGEGKHFIQVRALDALGHASPWSNVFEINFDKTGPSIDIPNYSVLGNVITPNVTNNDSTATFAWVQKNGPVDGVTVSSTQTRQPEFTVNTDGTYEYELTATDQAGNATKRTLIFTYFTPVTSTPPASTGEPTPSSQEPAAPTVLPNEAVTPSITGPSTFAAILGTNTTGNTDDADNNGTPAVEGATTQNGLAAAVDADNTDGNALGLAWYWWLLILAALAAIIWWIVAAFRNREQA